MRSTLSILATALFLAGQAVAFNSYVGCVTYGSLPAQGVFYVSAAVLPSADPAGCAAGCEARTNRGRFGYSAWQSNSQDCSCLPLGGTGSQPGFADATRWQPSTDAAGTCAPMDASIYRVGSAWQTAALRCTSRLSSEGRTLPPFDAGSVDECSAACRTYPIMVLVPLSAGTFRCTCTTALSDTMESTCGINQGFVYGRSAAAIGSGAYRRSLKETAKRQIAARSLKHAYCPEELQACNVGGSTGGYECMDTQYELESCGGCASGEFGVASSTIGIDCTRLSGIPMGAVSCLAGKCVAFACEAGWRLQAGVCVKA